MPAAAPSTGEVTEPSSKAVILMLSYDLVAELASESAQLEAKVMNYSEQHE